MSDLTYQKVLEIIADAPLDNWEATDGCGNYAIEGEFGVSFYDPDTNDWDINSDSNLGVCGISRDTVELIAELYCKLENAEYCLNKIGECGSSAGNEMLRIARSYTQRV